MAVPYKAVEQAFTSNVDLLIEEAPRGSDSEADNRRLRGLEVHADNLGEEAQTLLDEWLETRSPSVRRKQRDKELEWEEATKRLREARERRDRLAQPFVMRRLEALRAALTAKPLDVVEANRAMKDTIEMLVLDPKQARLDVYWRDADVVGYVFVHSRHSTIFSDLESPE